MAVKQEKAGKRATFWRAWQAFGFRHGRIAALIVFVFGALVHALLSHVFSTTYADEIEALLAELYVFQCVPLDSADAAAVAVTQGPTPIPLAGRLRELDVTSVRVLLIERAVQGLGDHRQDAVEIVAEVLRYDPDLNTRAGAVLALSYLGAEAGPALPELLDRLADPDEDIRLRRLILDRLPGIGPAPETVIPVLVALRDSEPDPGLRSKLAKALIEFETTPGR